MEKFNSLKLPVLESFTCSISWRVWTPESLKSRLRPPLSPILICWNPAEIWTFTKQIIQQIQIHNSNKILQPTTYMHKNLLMAFPKTLLSWHLAFNVYLLQIKLQVPFSVSPSPPVLLHLKSQEVSQPLVVEAVAATELEVYICRFLIHLNTISEGTQKSSLRLERQPPDHGLCLEILLSLVLSF